MKKSPKLSEKELVIDAAKEEEIILPKAIWSGNIAMGLVNIPVKAIPIIRDKGISFKMIHKTCETPIHYKKFCEEGEEFMPTKSFTVLSSALENMLFSPTRRSKLPSLHLAIT